MFAVAITPREEEPQINVTMANVFVPFPSASAADVRVSVTRDYGATANDEAQQLIRNPGGRRHRGGREHSAPCAAATSRARSTFRTSRTGLIRRRRPSSPASGSPTAPAENVQFFNVGLLNGRMAAMGAKIEALERELAEAKSGRK